jgi:hypothetical protein
MTVENITQLINRNCYTTPLFFGYKILKKNSIIVIYETVISNISIEDPVFTPDYINLISNACVLLQKVKSV